jgi:integrase
VNPLGTDLVPADRVEANQTRARSAPSVRLLTSPAAAGHAALLAAASTRRLPPDQRFNRAGVAMIIQGYDVGLPPPVLPPGAAGLGPQGLDRAGTVEVVMERVCRPLGMDRKGAATVRRRTMRLLAWLETFEAPTWEQRWLASGADEAAASWAAGLARVGAARARTDTATAVHALLLARVIRPSFGWLLGWRTFGRLYGRFWQLHEPDAWSRLQQLPAYEQALPRHRINAEACLGRVMIRTGLRCEQLRGDDLLHYADVVRTSGRARREHLAWDLMVGLGPFAGEPLTLRAAWSAKGNTRQHSTATLVDRYGIPAGAVRDLLVDYLGELRPSMDYSSLEHVAYRLARLFWREVVTINPAQTDLRLDADTARTWRERLALTCEGLPREDVHSILFTVRAFYRDLAEWAHDDPARWGVWAAPCPVTRHDSRRASTARRRQRARTQARTRALTPLLPRLVAAALAQKERGEQLLAAAQAAAPGEEFTSGGARLRRINPQLRSRYVTPSHLLADLLDPPPGPDGDWLPVDKTGRVNVTRVEEDGFWGWAIVETLRLTGIRVEELQELTQLGLRHYTDPTTGTLVPLLHIVPSKNDAERLIPMSPDLVSVLVAVQRRGKGDQAAIPLSIRYDYHEKTHGQPFPHLFARRVGTRHEVLSMAVIRRLLTGLARLADLRDAGQPIAFTPHDFRRLFTTELVGSGLPLHIAATLLGHLSLETTRGYTAVFPEDVIAAHHAFVERRRTVREDHALREATEAEWAEFSQHFLLRKVALGDCHRPYGTPCIHEHACTRCRFLRLDPAAGGRLEEMTTNTCARLGEARDRGWLGEVAALEDQLKHLRQRQQEAGRETRAITLQESRVRADVST